MNDNNMIYRVKVGYNDFDFTDHTTADGFAALAKSHFSGGAGSSKITVTVVYMTQDELNQEVAE